MDHMHSSITISGVFFVGGVVYSKGYLKKKKKGLSSWVTGILITYHVTAKRKVHKTHSFVTIKKSALMVVERERESFMHLRMWFWQDLHTHTQIYPFFTYVHLSMQQKCGATVEWFTCQCRTYTGRGLLDPSQILLCNLEKSFILNLMMKLIGRSTGMFAQRYLLHMFFYVCNPYRDMRPIRLTLRPLTCFSVRVSKL